MKAQMMNNLEAVGDMIGSLKGIADGLESDVYMEGLIEEAHGKAANAFDLAAASAGAAGHMTHAWEFGTAGITAGPVRFPDPVAPSARLWEHWMVGNGGNQDIGYSFRPALNRNPRPTVASTGVPSKYLAKLSNRKYIFWNKAYVMETGQTVEITPKSGNLLFIPFYGQPAMDGSKRTFMMFPGNAQLRPGRSSKGTFTSFWMSWWAHSGNEIIEHDMEKNVTIDLAKAEAEAAKKAAAQAMMKPAAAVNVLGVSAKARSLARRVFGTKRKTQRRVR